jgi:hypothetical protein
VPWLLTWIVSVLVFAICVGSLEIFWRSRGYRLNVPDSIALWAYHRTRVVGDDPKIIVAIGTSRARADISPEVMTECLPGYRFVQLGINGASSPIGVLAEISAIPRFRGTILCDLLPPLADRSRWEEQAAFYSEPVPRFVAFNTYVYSLLCDHCLVVSSVVSLRECFGATEPHFGANQIRFRVHADRSVDCDESPANVSREAEEEAIREYATRLKQTKRYKNVDAFKENVAPLGEVVSRIVHNGGHVVFLRLPAAGPRLQMEETAFPTAVYFNALAQATSAEWIDFRSLSHYQDFDCPDGSHLSPRGSQRLSRSLVAELTRRRLLPQGRGEVKVNGDGQVH